MEFKAGDRVRIPDPLADGAEIEGVFLNVVGEPVEVPGLDGGAMGMRDAAWVWCHDGSTACVLCVRIRPGRAAVAGLRRALRELEPSGRVWRADGFGSVG